MCAARAERRASCRAPALDGEHIQCLPRWGQSLRGARKARVMARRWECGPVQRVSGASTNGLLHVSIQTCILTETCQISPRTVLGVGDNFCVGDGVGSSHQPRHRSWESRTGPCCDGFCVHWFAHPAGPVEMTSRLDSTLLKSQQNSASLLLTDTFVHPVATLMPSLLQCHPKWEFNAAPLRRMSFSCVVQVGLTRTA